MIWRSIRTRVLPVLLLSIVAIYQHQEDSSYGDNRLFADALLPFDAIARDTIGAIGKIHKNIRQRIYEKKQQRGGAPIHPIEHLDTIKDVLIEDYVDNHGKRVQKMCEYLKQGRMYRGPCSADNNHQQQQQHGNGGGYGDGGRREGVEHEGGNGGGGYGGGGNGGYGRSQRQREPVEVVKIVEKEIYVEPGNGRGGRHRGGGGGRHHGRHGGGRGRGHGRGGGGHRGGYDGGRDDDGYQPQPSKVVVVVDDEKEDYQVRPEKIAEDQANDEQVFDEEINQRRRPPPGKNQNGNKIGRQQKKNQEGEPCQTSYGSAGFCMPASFCYVQYGGVEAYRKNICELGGGISGICCSKDGRSTDNSFELPIRVPTQSHPSVKIRFISLEDINTAAKEAQKIIQQYIKVETDLIRRGMVQRKGSMQSLHQAFFGDFDPVQFQLTKGGFLNLITTIMIMKRFKLTNEQARDGLYKYSIEHTDLEQSCIKEPTCIQSKYRSSDGSCNNLQRPLWGKSNTAFERLVPPNYDDGLHEPKTKSFARGDPLPSARLVSVQLARAQNRPDPQYTLMLMQWGQFIDHDLTLAASTRAATGQGLTCCDERSQTPVKHHACFPIIIPNNDPFYSRFGQRCMHLVRNSPSPRSGCALGHREQMNTLSHVLDGSMVYGSTSDRARSLRTFRDGRLKSSLVRNTEFLPFDQNNSTDECGISEREQRQFKCFIGGDVRVNEQTGLTMIHNIFLREHNRVVGILKQFHRNWNDESLFQEARRIVVSEIQHINYNEWLPIVVGHNVMSQFGILPKSFGFTKDYNPRVNPNILNEFATAAFRFHSLIEGTFVLLDNQGNPTHRFKLHTLFNKPISLYMPNAFDHYLNGFTTEPAQAWDSFFTEEITNHLFEEENSGFGMDLVALNIQRGRDHGLPGYNSYRRACGMQPLKSFRDLNSVMEEGSAEMMSRMYRHVDDIDLFIAGVHERALPDALIGPTFACIIGEQARRLKIGDRFWYENGGLPHSFSNEQLGEIRKSSMAMLICENADQIQQIQPLAFLRPVGWNKKIDCRNIARMDLSPWRNEKLWN